MRGPSRIPVIVHHEAWNKAQVHCEESFVRMAKLCPDEVV